MESMPFCLTPTLTQGAEIRTLMVFTIRKPYFGGITVGAGLRARVGAKRQKSISASCRFAPTFAPTRARRPAPTLRQTFHA